MNSRKPSRRARHRRARQGRGRARHGAPMPARDRISAEAEQRHAAREAVRAVHEIVEIDQPEHQETTRPPASTTAPAPDSDAIEPATASRWRRKRTRAGKPAAVVDLRHGGEESRRQRRRSHRRRRSNQHREHAHRHDAPAAYARRRARVQRTVVRDVGGEAPGEAGFQERREDQRAGDEREPRDAAAEIQGESMKNGNSGRVISQILVEWNLFFDCADLAGSRRPRVLPRLIRCYRTLAFADGMRRQIPVRRGGEAGVERNRRAPA